MPQQPPPPLDLRAGAAYRGMDPATLDRAYDNSAAVADSAAWPERWSRSSAALRARMGGGLGMRYGAAERQELDYFACGMPAAPLLVFFHGGYWQRNHRDMFSFIAEGPMAHGFDVAVVGYTLAPEARLQQIVDECRAAADFLFAQQQAAALPFDAARMVVGGWSAGGHLAAMLVRRDHRPRGALSISGIFDLEPVWRSKYNEKLGLRAEDVPPLSPLYRIDPATPPVCAAYGTGELPELQRQSVDYARAANAAGARVAIAPMADHHHYSILDELCRADGKLIGPLRALAGSAGS